jgi:hypothetical protein
MFVVAVPRDGLRGWDIVGMKRPAHLEKTMKDR